MSRCKSYNPSVPRCYSDLSDYGKRGVDRHLEGHIELPKIKQDGRLNCLRVIADLIQQGDPDGEIPQPIFHRLVKERRLMKED